MDCRSVGNHPNVVQFLGIFTNEQNEQFMIFEYCRKGSLLEFLRSIGDLPLQTLLEM